MTTCDSRLNCVLLIVFLTCLPSVAQDEVAAVEDVVELSPVELLKSGLGSEDADKRTAAIYALADSDLEAAQRAAVIDLLLKALDDEVPDIRALAAEMIGQFGDDAKHAIPRLLEQAGDPSMTVKLRGVWVSVSKALAAIGPAALQPMLNAIPDSDRITYFAITGAIGARFVLIRCVCALRDANLGDTAPARIRQRVLQEAIGGVPTRTVSAGRRVIIDV